LEFTKNGQSLNLKEDPSLLCLVDDPLEEAGACLDKEWVLLVLLFVLQDVDVLADDLVIN
jgi:hypothetical protein